MPLSVSQHLAVSPSALATEGAFDAILDVDSRLFIDPHLLRDSTTPELAGAHAKIEKRFEEILRILSHSKTPEDSFGRAATRLFHFPELAGLCIGYSKSGTNGSGMGAGLTKAILETAKELVDAGVTDPEIFELIGLFEPGVGADRISDMVGNIIAPNLLEFTQRVARNLKVVTTSFPYLGTRYDLVRSPFNSKPIVLVPVEILRDLPVAHDWSDVDVVCAANEDLRRKVNKIVGDSWKRAMSIPKKELKRALVENPELMRELIDSYRSKPATPYDFDKDPAGEVIWHAASVEATTKNPLPLTLGPAPTVADIKQVVATICAKFRDLVENNNLSKLLFKESGKPKHESAAQLLFFGIANAYCEANKLDLSPESNAGRGPVDFKLSAGYHAKVLVEVKLSTNPRLMHGVKTQLAEYQKAECTDEATCLILCVGGSEIQLRKVTELIRLRKLKGDKVPTLVTVDARRKASASKYHPPASE